jgi:flagellar biosynthetic protein FlhB
MADHDTDPQDRTLPPSEKRLADAREEGRVARSRHLTTFLVLGGMLAGMAAYGPQAVTGLRDMVANGLVLDAAEARDSARLAWRLAAAAGAALLVIAPILALLWAGSALLPLAQGGFVLTGKPLEPDFDRLDPVAGFKRIASLDSLAELGKTMAIAAFVGGAAVWGLWALREQAAGLASLPLAGALGASGRAVAGALWSVVGVLAVIAAIDVFHERRRYQRSLRMTPDESRREAREQEGDPHLKARIRQAQREGSRRRMMAAVPKADVVVTNPTHYAVALRYDDKAAGAPRVVAMGRGPIALRIREIAEAAGVVRLEAPPLARALYHHAELDREIPAALYQAVAQVLAYVYQLRRHARGEAPAPRAPEAIGVPDGFDAGPDPEPAAS